MTTVNGSLTIGVIGHKGSGGTLCSILGEVFREGRLCTNTMFTPNTAIFCVSDTARVNLIDIAVDKWKRQRAVRDISHCDVIIYIISAVESEGEISNEDTARMMRRYLQIGHVFGVKHFIIAMNKMNSPSVSYSKQIFDEMKERVKEIVDKTNVDDYCIVPIGSCYDRNIATKSEFMEWYDGLTLKEIINEITPIRNEDGPGLLSVSKRLEVKTEDVRSPYVCRYSNSRQCYVHDLIIGKMICGKLSVGDNIKIFPSGKKAKIQSIGRHQERVNEAFCGDIVGIKLDGLPWREFRDIERGHLIQFDDDSVGGNTFQNVVRFSAIIHIQRWSQKNQEMVTEFVTASDPNREWWQQCEFTMLMRGVRVQCSIRSIEWKMDGQHQQRMDLVSEKAFKDPVQSFPSSFQQGDTAKVVLDVVSPICMSPFKRNRKLGSFIITHQGPREVMTHFGFGKVVDILLSENDLFIQEHFAINKVDYRQFAVTYCNHIERNMLLCTSIAEEVIHIISGYCGGNRVVYFKDPIYGSCWEVFSRLEGKDIVKMVIKGEYHLFLESNGTVWEHYARYGSWKRYRGCGHVFVENKYFKDRGIKIKDIALSSIGLSSMSLYGPRPMQQECYAVDCKGIAYHWRWRAHQRGYRSDGNPTEINSGWRAQIIDNMFASKN